MERHEYLSMAPTELDARKSDIDSGHLQAFGWRSPSAAPNLKLLGLLPADFL
jgi:hypothetical protein